MLRILAACTLLALPTLAAAQGAEGVWRTAPSDSGASLNVRIGRCGVAVGRLCGEIVEVFGCDRTDLVGRTMLSDMAADGPGRWSGGTIWAPDDDRTYRSRMRLTAAGLEVEGCVAVFCRGQVWRRVE
jgi:uncharacterized protein (DUF2147 family)